MKKTIVLLSIGLLMALPSCRKVEDDKASPGYYGSGSSSSQKSEDDSI